MMKKTDPWQVKVMQVLFVVTVFSMTAPRIVQNVLLVVFGLWFLYVLKFVPLKDGE
jgi:hypothetical protein